MTLREISSNHNDTGRIKRYSNLNTILGSPDTVTETPGSSLPHSPPVLLGFGVGSAYGGS